MGKKTKQNNTLWEALTHSCVLRGPATVASQVPTAQAGNEASLSSSKRSDAFSQTHLHRMGISLQRNASIDQEKTQGPVPPSSPQSSRNRKAGGRFSRGSRSSRAEDRWRELMDPGTLEG